MKTEKEIRAALAALLADQWTMDAPAPPVVGPPTTDPRPVVVFRPTGGDDTAALQGVLDKLSNDSILDIRDGFALVNTRGLIVGNKRGSKITASNGGGLRAIGNGVYSTPYSSMLYAEGMTDCSFDGLKLDCNGKNAQAIFVNKSSSPKVLNCEAWNIRHLDSGPPYAAIKVDASTDPEIASNRVHDLTGRDGGEGVRGIWCGVGGDFSIRPQIHHNLVERTGHSGIVTESSGARVWSNIVRDVLVQGTGFKLIARGEALESTWEDNAVERCFGAGMMIEGGGPTPNIIVRRMTGRDIGRTGPGREFGLMYGNPSNLIVSDCQILRCMKLAAFNDARSIKFLNNTGDRLIVSLENNCSGISLVNSGGVEIGRNCSDVTVDGKRVA